MFFKLFVSELFVAGGAGVAAVGSDVVRASLGVPGVRIASDVVEDCCGGFRGNCGGSRNQILRRIFWVLTMLASTILTMLANTVRGGLDLIHFF